MKYTIRYLSATCIEICFGSRIDKSINDDVLKLYQNLPRLIDRQKEAIIDIVPSYTSLTIHFSSSCQLITNPHAFDAIIDKALGFQQHLQITQHTVYVTYNGEDIDAVCKTLKLSKDELITLHATSYSIAMIGFRAYFPYLLGLDPKLVLPRRDTPRVKVPKGSVAIAAGQTGIYSEDSPGGWHIIGHTDFDDFESLKPSDIITFKVRDEHV